MYDRTVDPRSFIQTKQIKGIGDIFRSCRPAHGVSVRRELQQLIAARNAFKRRSIGDAGLYKIGPEPVFAKLHRHIGDQAFQRRLRNGHRSIAVPVSTWAPSSWRPIIQSWHQRMRNKALLNKDRAQSRQIAGIRHRIVRNGCLRYSADPRRQPAALDYHARWNEAAAGHCAFFRGRQQIAG